MPACIFILNNMAKNNLGPFLIGAALLATGCDEEARQCEADLAARKTEVFEQEKLLQAEVDQLPAATTNHLRAITDETVRYLYRVSDYNPMPPMPSEASAKMFIEAREKIDFPKMPENINNGGRKWFIAVCNTDGIVINRAFDLLANDPGYEARLVKIAEKNLAVCDRIDVGDSKTYWIFNRKLVTAHGMSCDRNNKIQQLTARPIDITSEEGILGIGDPDHFTVLASTQAVFDVMKEHVAYVKGHSH